MNKNELRYKYKADFKIAQNEVNLFDPFGLIKGGAPIDEYDFLTDIILSGIYRGLLNDELIDLIVSELSLNFDVGDSLDNKHFRNRVEELITEIKKQIN